MYVSGCGWTHCQPAHLSATQPLAQPIRTVAWQQRRSDYKWRRRSPAKLTASVPTARHLIADPSCCRCCASTPHAFVHHLTPLSQPRGQSPSRLPCPLNAEKPGAATAGPPGRGASGVPTPASARARLSHLPTRESKHSKMEHLSAQSCHQRLWCMISA